MLVCSCGMCLSVEDALEIWVWSVVSDAVI